MLNNCNWIAAVASGPTLMAGLARQLRLRLDGSVERIHCKTAHNFFYMRSWVLFCHKWTTLSCLSCKSTFQKALAADIAALEADALLGALLLEAAVTEAPAREVLHARLEKFESVLGAHRRVGECLEVGDAWIFH